jgi:cellulose synthase/poly-beta-1,6-N-acetylglucosamine synthase-like glycosyltransferase
MSLETWFYTTDLAAETLQAAVLEPDVAFVILARDEADILEETILDLQTYLARDEVIHVVADACQDRTAEVARDAGAVVWERNADRISGKGAALGWWMRQTADQDPDQVIVVLDADSRLTPDFAAGMRRRFTKNILALQCRILPSLSNETPGALISALSELSEQFVDDALRNKAGWPVRLRGTGMAFRRSVLSRFATGLHTMVEDVELSLLLTAGGVHIVSAPELIVLDPKPTSDKWVIRQRARWLRGQAQVWKDYRSAIFRILCQGLPGVSLLASLLLKPKTLLWLAGALVSLLLLGLSALTGLQLGGVFAASVTGLYAMMEGIKILYTMSRIPDRQQIWKALLFSPLFLLVWLSSMFLAVRSGKAWLRSRPGMNPTRIG